MNINELLNLNSNLYGRRNALFFTNGTRDILDNLSRTVGLIQDRIRKTEPGEKPKIGINVSNSLIWWAGAVNSFNGHVNASRGIAYKYPYYGCGYCGQKPCDCSNHDRPKHQKRGEKDCIEGQYYWSLNRWVDHLGAIYGDANKKKPVEDLTLRLFKEVEEIRELLSVRLIGRQDELILELEQEFADVFSWLVQFAYIFEFDLEKVLFDTFGRHCPACKEKPCVCRRFISLSSSEEWMTIGTTNKIK